MAEWFVYVCWLALLFVILFQFLTNVASSGLLLCYWLILAMNHFFGHYLISISLLPELGYDQMMSNAGFEVSGYAVLGLLSGLLATSLFLRFQTRAEVLSLESPVNMIARRVECMKKFSTSCIVIGLIIFLLAAVRFFEFLPSATSVVSGSTLVVVSGTLMKWWIASRANDPSVRRARWFWLVLILLYPVYTTLFLGFIGFGVTLLLIFGCLLWKRIKYRQPYVLVVPLIIYFGLMIWMAYAQVRGELRAHVADQSDTSVRINVLVNGFIEHLSWIDTDNPRQMMAMGRLNQNVLIGESVRYIEVYNGKSAQGETFIDAAISLVPRVLWPGKPAYGGSGGLVTRYTGIMFAEGTSVGIGQIMECYVNFGRWFVFGVFAILGIILKWIDSSLDAAFHQFRSAQVLFYTVIGVNLLNVIGCFSETLPAIVGAAILVGFVVFLHNIIYPKYRV